MTRWRWLMVVGLSLLAPAAKAEERILVLRPAQTQVSFLLKATGHEVRGALALEAGQIRFDPATGQAAGEVRIDVRQAQTGNRLRDRQMHDEVLESAHYPLIVFHPQRLDGAPTAAPSSDVVLRGTVSLRGGEHPLAVPARIRTVGDRVSIEAAFDVPYVSWGLPDPSFLFLRVAPVVAVTIRSEGDLQGGAAADAQQAELARTR